MKLKVQKFGNQSPAQNHSNFPSSASSHFGWLLGGGVFDLARRGDAESRDAMLAVAARQGLDPFFCLSFGGRSRGAYHIWGFPWPWGYHKMDGHKGKSHEHG